MELQSYNYATQEEQQRYLELLVRQLQAGLGKTGYTITPATSSEINTFINRNYTPILPVGTMWFDSTISKLKVIVTQAIPGVADATVEIVTSV